LRDLLTRVADPHSPIFTVGCDLGSMLIRFTPTGSTPRRLFGRTAHRRASDDA
jgi:hypothetical protein